MQHDGTAIEARHGAAIEGREQRLFVGRDQIDQMLVERLAFGEGLALAHGGFGNLAVAPAFGADAAHVGGGVVLHLLLHGGVHIAELGDGVSRASVGSGRHGGYVARFQNEEARRSGAATARFDVGDDGDGRGDDFLNGFAHRVHQSAGSVEANDEERGVLLFGASNGASDDLDGDGMNDPIHIHGDDLHGRGKRRCRQRESDC